MNEYRDHNAMVATAEYVPAHFHRRENYTPPSNYVRLEKAFEALQRSQDQEVVRVTVEQIKDLREDMKDSGTFTPDSIRLIDERLRRAQVQASTLRAWGSDTLERRLQRMRDAGMKWREIAEVEGVNAPSLRQIFSRCHKRPQLDGDSAYNTPIGDQQ